MENLLDYEINFTVGKKELGKIIKKAIDTYFGEQEEKLEE